MLEKLKQKRLEFEYNALKDKSLYGLMSIKNFKMAAYKIENQTGSINLEDFEFCFSHLSLYNAEKQSKRKKKHQRQDLLYLIKTLKKHAMDQHINEHQLMSAIYGASTAFDQELLSAYLNVPCALNIEHEKNFYDRTLYYFLPKNDTRRKALNLDNRDSPLHTESGVPELVKLIDNFDIKRKAHQEKPRNKQITSIAPQR